jgi:hypothetical protein
VKQQRYSCEAQILKHIDNVRELIKAKIWEAERLKQEGNAWIKAAADPAMDPGSAELLRSNGKSALEKADTLGRQAENLTAKRLPKLRVKLAQMRTEVMPFMTDRSVVK